MRLKWIALLGVVVLAGPASAAEKQILKTEKDKINYGIGVSVGRNFKQQGLEVDVNMVVKGLKDELAGKKLLLSEDELRKTMTAFQMELRQKQMQKRKMAGLNNGKEGEAFLAANRKKEGVVTLPDGLQYKILKKGEGKKPTAADTVAVRYRGTFINGKEFDSSGSATRTFKLSQVISGWREALQLMPAGSKWQLFVPPKLAYGEQGLRQVIMPNATLIFDVELVGIKTAEGTAPAVKK
jgi:FKBP-type peptidyl-prolyl cis-trans isomerase